MRKVVVPVYQPILDLQTHTIAHYEALARIRNDSDPNGHTRLIRMGEEIGFIDLVDLAMLEQVFEVLDAYPQLTISANFSVSTIERATREVLPLIYHHLDLAPRLIVEITETVSIRDLGSVERFVRAARHAGARVALDDYGVGTSTVDHISQLEPDLVKLDGTLVAQLAEGFPLHVDAVKVAVARYGGEIVGELVDSEEKLRALAAHGIRYAQGYHIGHPSIHIADLGIEVKEMPWEDGKTFFGDVLKVLA